MTYIYIFDKVALIPLESIQWYNGDFIIYVGF